ncbi:MAG: zf-HC2 domain-containing protein [Planctomycetes bacterium]|nr:zf-HC2 domain-containing protein [Planctomycetota bacterium]
MTCSENLRALEAFLDGELDAEANLTVAEHLRLCGDCTLAFDAERRLRGALREKACGPKAPPELMARVRKTLDGADRSIARRRLLSSLAAAAIFVAVLVGVLTISGPPSEAEVVAFAAEFHDRNRDGCTGPSICCACAEQPKTALARFFKQQADYEPCVHDLDAAGYRFRSGVVGTLRGRALCWTVQRNEARASFVSHTMLPPDQLPKRRQHGWRRYEVKGRVVLVVDMPGFV